MTQACKNPTCGKDLGALPKSAPHKLFCSTSCRNDYHNARLKRAKELLAQAERGVDDE